ncbi:RNA polymerase sigma-70 factor [Bacteroides sp.]
MRISLYESNAEKEFRKLYEEYYAPFCIYARRFINDMTVCEDIVSDVFASLWDKRDSVELKINTATAYLKTCVRNSCLNYLKHLEHEFNYNEFCQKQSPVYATETDSIYTLNELYDRLFKTLNGLPEYYRVVFTKSFFEGKTHAEIAEELNLSIKSINRYKQKTMEFLREEFKEYLPVLLSLIMLQGKFA